LLDPEFISKNFSSHVAYPGGGVLVEETYAREAGNGTKTARPDNSMSGMCML